MKSSPSIWQYLVSVKLSVKISSIFVAFLENTNFTKLILDDHGNNLDSFRISLESFRSFRGPLLHKPVTGQELFFAVYYSKFALAAPQ